LGTLNIALGALAHIVELGECTHLGIACAGGRLFGQRQGRMQAGAFAAGRVIHVGTCSRSR
jgi:hypothetical protein